MTEDELKRLYAEVLDLAQNIPACERLDDPQASVTMVSPLCGSQITVDLVLDDGRVSRFGQKVRACTLGAAAASIVGSRILGRSAEELRELRVTMRRMLKDDGPSPSGEFAQLSLLEPARDLVSRHGSILLVFDAVGEAIDEIEGRTCAPATARRRGIPDTVRA